MIDQKTMSPLSWGLMLLLALIWGGSFYWAEIALAELGPLTIVAFRVTMAAPVLWLVLRIIGLEQPNRAIDWMRLLVMGVLNNVIPFSLIVWGQQFIEGGLASILNATTALFGAIVAGLLLADERLTPKKIAGALIGVVGVAVCIGPGLLDSFDPKSIGQLAILGAALSYSLASVWGRKQLGGFHPYVNAFGMVTAAAVVMVPLAIWQDGIPSFDYSTSVWFALICISWAATAMAYLLFFTILKQAGAANLMLVTLLVPPSAIFLGWFFLGEALSLYAWIGFGIITIGLIVTDGRLLKRFRSKA
ncbi:MAG: DMT family transporter [Pseudomonadota bacterium]